MARKEYFKSGVGFVPLPLILAGSVLTHIYLYGVKTSSFPISLLFVGVFLQSAGLLALLLPMLTGSKRHINPVFYIICILALSVSINYIRVTRFDFVMGCDTLREIKGAKVVWLAKSWDPYYTPPGLIVPAYKYQGALSVTIFPTIVCELIEVDVESFFRFFMPIMVALNSLFVFLMIRDFFGDSSITYLSAALVPLLFFQQQLLDMTRSAIGLPLLWLMIHTLLRKTGKSRLLSSIFAFGAVSVHYTVGYYGFFISLCFLMLPSLFYRFMYRLNGVIHKEQKVVKGGFILSFTAIILFWLCYSGIYLFTWHVQQLQSLLDDLISLTFHGALLRHEQSYILKSPRGPIITMWFDMQFLLMGVGGLIALIDCIRRRVAHYAQVSWILMGSLMIGVLLSTMLPYISLYIEAGRLICYSLPFLCSFMAIALLKLRGYARLFSVFFLLLVLPMNMMLPAYQGDIMYQSEKELTPSRLLDYRSTKLVTLAGKAVGIWIENYRPLAHEHIDVPKDFGRKEPFTCDATGYLALMLTSISTQDTFITTAPSFSSTTPSPIAPVRFRYMLISDLYIKYGLWSAPEFGRARTQSTGRYSTTPSLDIVAETLFQDPLLNLVYNNGGFSIIRREGELNAYCSWEPRPRRY